MGTVRGSYKIAGETKKRVPVTLSSSNSLQFLDMQVSSNLLTSSLLEYGGLLGPIRHFGCGGLVSSRNLDRHISGFTSVTNRPSSFRCGPFHLLTTFLCGIALISPFKMRRVLLKYKTLILF